MATENNDPVSRRNWLGLVATASLGTGLMGLAPKAFGTGKPIRPQDRSFGARTYDVRAFGAKGDGKTLDTEAIQAAIDACHQERSGCVMIPAGVFVTGTLEMKSDVILHISAGATLLGSADGRQYHAADAIPLSGDATLEDGNVGLIFAVNAENFTIEGNGRIDGQGAQFRHPTKDKPSPAGLSSHQRPYHLLFYRCHNVTVRDLFLKDCAYHSVRVVQCAYVKLEGLHIHGRVIYNNDGFHFISSQYVHINHCDVESQDDACALFGSCQYITISNCSFSTRWSVFRFGGGIAKNIVVSNCILYEVYGCPVKMRCGPGSVFEDISFSDIVMKDVTGPVSIGLGPGHEGSAPGEKAPGIIRNITFSNIRASVAKPGPLRDAEYQSHYNPGEIFSCITLNAFDAHFLEGITFSNVHVTFPGGGTKDQGAVRDVPKVAGEYYTMGVPPSYGLFARNVKGLSLQNVRFDLAGPDRRPALVLDHVEDAAVHGFGIEGDPDAESAIRAIECKDILFSAGRLLSEAAVFLSVEGASNENIKVDGGDLSKATVPVSFGGGAGPQSVRMRD